MEMNEILNGLNSCGCNDDIAATCPTQSIGTYSNNNNNGFFGFGSWIWILLILFYSGGFTNSNRNNGGCCCKKERKRDCCCGGNNGGGLGSCTPYLFLLVILFLCNGTGFSNYGNFGGGSLFSGCC
ncbi:MAG: hypothetical protein IJO26_04485 [Clostridium sp.]|nr:hypothetical protein [Clostridium sp.]